MGSFPSMRWSEETLSADLMRLERSVLFDSMLQQLWEQLLNFVNSAKAPSGSATGAAAGASGAVNSKLTKRGVQV